MEERFINTWHQMSKDERTIYIECKRHGKYKEPITHKYFEQFKIDKRMLAATVREMNEKYKGWFHIGSDKRGYWFCWNEKEALASMASYNQTILSMLGERKKIKEQIRLTFAKDTNLFGEPVLLADEFTEAMKEPLFGEVKNPFMETS